MTRTVRENHTEKGIFEQRLKRDFLGGSVVKTLFSNAGDTGDAGSVPGLGRSHGGGNGNPLPHPCLENPMDRGAWQATVHGVAKSRTCLSGRAHLRDKGTIMWESRGEGFQRNGTAGATCISMADSCQCMTRTTTIL